METRTYIVKKFDELSEEERERAIEKHRDINTDFEWYDLTLDNWKTDLAAMGFNDVDIQFSGFWSQGDGASFTAKSVDLDLFLKSQKTVKDFRLLWVNREYIHASVIRISHQYSHPYTVRGAVEDYGIPMPEAKVRTEKIDSQLTELETLLTETVRDTSRKIYKELEDEYEYQTSDEAIADTLRANEYNFKSNGEID